MEHTGLFSGYIGKPKTSGRYWNRSLGPFYSELSNRLLCYLLMALACLISTFASAMVLYSPSWLSAHLEFISALAIHVAFFYAGGYAAVDILADRLGTGVFNYQRRTVASQWMVMLTGFLLAYALYRSTYFLILDLYAPWVVEHFEAYPEQRRTIAFELIYFTAWWFPKAFAITSLSLCLQKRIQKSESKQKRNRQKAFAGSNDQTRAAVLVHEANGESIALHHDAITHVSAEDKYCRIHHQTGQGVKHHLLRLTLKQLLEELRGEEFFQVHRSHLVNLAHALGWKSEQHKRFLIMEHGDQLPISRSRMAELKPIFKRLKLPRLN